MQLCLQPSPALCGEYPVSDVGIAFCSQLSKSQYEKQGQSASQRALTQLLDSILHDERMSSKDKKRRLKQVNPDIITGG